ncbi:MAG TPA: membrane-bound PQQ-dependent dehydrogenase, glucose/quinate/shikimate family, partial [Sphingomonas sp.]|nr:membrane-bound PQQ-dependent dehydrogenase, glucose/quinate/shikimate family [Sphingomonas sp.]
MQDETAAPSRRHAIPVLLVGGLLALIGAVLIIGGIWLAAIGGSIYYLLAGFGLAASGVLLVRGRSLGAWLYAAIWLLTIIWALWEVGLNGWALIPRVVGPSVLLVLVLLILPIVEGWRWRTALGASAAFVLLLVISGFVISRVNQPHIGALPGVIASTVADPSLLKPGTDWPAYGGSHASQRYSPLRQITPENVSRLERAWLYHTGDMPEGDLKDSKYGAETTPLKVGNTLYLCSAMNVLIALDPATGQQRWRFDPKVSDEWIPYTAACRGVAYYVTPGAAAESECAARIFEGTLDGRLIAVDARTGRPCSGFGTN